MVMFLLNFVKGSKSAEGGPNPRADMDRGGPNPLGGHPNPLGHRHREVTGSNPVEVLTFSGFSTQLLKLR